MVHLEKNQLYSKLHNYEYLIADNIKIPRLSLNPRYMYYYYELVKEFFLLVQEFSLNVNKEANTKINLGCSIRHTASSIIEVDNKSGSF